MNTKLINIIKNTIDIHYHIGPEVIPRKYDVDKLTKVERDRITGFVLKNHFYPTQPLIGSPTGTKPYLFGGIVLNNSVGGLNPEAIYASTLLNNYPLMVWFPTINATNFLNKSRYEIAPEWVNDSNFISRKSSDIKPVQLKNNLVRTLRAIKDTNSILATGHIAPRGV